MTLAKQLYALIFIIALMMGVGTLVISVENTRSYLILQLASQTQNAADSLGLSLVPHMKGRDIAVMDTMVNAVFDSGYYKSLKLKSMSGESLIERENTSRIEGVPQWFINNLTLETPIANSVITTGWTQSGTLTLEAHPGYAYKKLWETSIQTFYLAVLVFLLSFLFAFLVLKAILRPLTAVEQQALAICEREFPIVARIPKTRELQRVVLAMNKMSAKVQSIILHLTARAEMMQKEAHFDDLTALMNRRGFLAVLENTVKDREGGGFGSLALIRLSHFADYNKQFGFQAGDALLMDVATLIKQRAESFDNATVARSEGGEFGVLFPLLASDDVKAFGEQCANALSDLAETLPVNEIAHIGITSFSEEESVSDLLANADMALASAEHQSPNSYFISHTKSIASGNIAWKKLITESMAQQHIRFLHQPVVTSEAETIFWEILIRVKDEHGKDIPPGAFASMADRLELNSDLDRYIIMQVTALLKLPGFSNHAIAIKLSTRSVHDRAFIQWLDSHLQTHQSIASSLLFEVSEHAFLHDQGLAEELIKMVHTYQGRMVMEHFGTKLSSFKTLRKLKLDYIKLDGSYIRNISENRDNRFFIQTVIDIAHGLDIQVIAEHVETDEDKTSLKALGINAMQGYLFGAPTELK
ncbi:EAL domain-containing protein [Mariprofundus sp. EBB-1]|uniref:bifunctional diguanylate cyclase/phosphodiesterase n=1 Tax=Mariprofundus sp. EBB-1 TaxID=2650971 RepID=UPI000EF2696F|nr:EAL domain-containing protein [Mariprofundus sp. EBB-1]RLL55903.1 EAL domain-containing protein [Mariprofundus sp. EBB-1]